MDTQLDLWRMLCRLNYEYNYAEYLRPLQLKGKRAFIEGTEDHGLIGAFLVKVADASSPTIEDRVEDEPSYTPYQGVGQVADNLKELSKHYDGAIVLDDHQMSSYVVFDGLLRGAREKFSQRFGTPVRFFSELIPHFVPGSFSASSGGHIQMGSKSKNALGAAIWYPDVESYLLKVTAFGRTGTGKVIRKRLDPSTWRFHFQEFFLYHTDDLPRLADAPTLGESETIPYFDPANKIIGITRTYSANPDPASMGEGSSPGNGSNRHYRGPRLVESRLVDPAELGANPEEILKQGHGRHLESFKEREKGFHDRNPEHGGEPRKDWP